MLSYQPENNDNDDSNENTEFVNEVKPIGAERIEVLRNLKRSFDF